MAESQLETPNTTDPEETEVETRADRIRKLLIARGVPQRQQRRALSQACGISYEAVRQWFTGDTSNIDVDHLTAIAKTWKANLEWLITGKGPMDESDDLNFTNARKVAHDVRRIPVLNYIQAGNPKTAIDDYMAGDGMDEISIDANLAQELSMESFALVIRGNSMEPEFKEGDVVVIDPSVKPLPGDFVVAKLDRDGETTFKKYRSRGVDANGHHMFELVPLNEDYHTILVSSENPGHIVGTMMEKRQKRRR